MSAVLSNRRRAHASLRLVPLPCGCRDTWTCHCADTEPSDHAIDGWRDASRHLLAAGVTPIMPPEVGRALWRRGGADRKLVSAIASRGGFPTDAPPERPTAA